MWGLVVKGSRHAAQFQALADFRIVDVACGEAHSLAVSSTGNLYSWGACSCGQLGLGSCEGMPVDSDGYPYQPTPTLVTAGFQAELAWERQLWAVSLGGRRGAARSLEGGDLPRSWRSGVRFGGLCHGGAFR